MAQIVVSQDDVLTAQNFLEQFLSDSIPDGDFSKGTALRDLTIGALAAVFAYLTKEQNTIQSRQSLKTIQETVVDADPTSLRDSITALLSNFFISLKPGRYARGTAVGHTSQALDIFIQPTQRFTKSPGLVFAVDSTGTYVIQRTELLPVTDSNGVVIEYQFRIPLVALAIGPAFNIEPGLFSSFDAFSPYVTRIENTEKFAGGKSEESTAEVLARAPTAISIRNLINDRSIQAVLTDTFPDIKKLLVVGYGEPEMQRDTLEAVGPRLAVHVGGCTDIYVNLDIVEAVTTGTIGGPFQRSDGVAAIFRDADGRTFPGVGPGDILRIVSGLPKVPREFFVVSTGPGELYVSERIPFPVASDEQFPVGYLAYTVGRIPPLYNDLISNGGLPWPRGVSSRTVSIPGAITLPPGPVLDVLDVAITDPVVPELAYKSPVDGFIHFSNRVNSMPELNIDPNIALQYQLLTRNPLYAQSMQMWMVLAVGQVGNNSRYDGRHLRVRYRTLANYANIYNYVRSPANRVNNANQLPRAHHPIVVGMTIQYRLKTTAKAALNNALIAQTVADYINAFDTTTNPIDVSAISDLIRTVYTDIATVFPFVISYALNAPTGDLITFQTSNEVRMIQAKQVAGPLLDLLSLGVSDRTVRYISSSRTIVPVDVGGAIL